MEAKNLDILKRLRELREPLCCKHIDHQIELWYRATTTSSAIPPPAAASASLAPTSDNNNHIISNSTHESPEASINSAAIDSQPASDLPPQTQRLHPPPLSTSSRDHLDDERTIGTFLANVKHLESFDSDATESVSSNDSYDELEGFSLEDIPPRKFNFHTNPNHQHPASSAIYTGDYDPADLKKKAIWKWALERSRLASRWTWLQAQVADLEYRIRTQNEATMQARAYKTQPLPPSLPESSCSRTMPISKDFRRRRLIKSSKALSDSSKKLVKFSHVPCVCSSLPQTVAPCLSCNGRYNYLIQLDGENAPLSERVSLLDPCCHPVLSFPDDLTLGSQLAYLLKQETINKKPTKGRPGRKKGSTAAKLKSEASKTMIASNKLKRKYKTSQHHLSLNKCKHLAYQSSNDWVDQPARRKKRARSTSSSISAQGVTRNTRRRSEQSAFDINNIVIPLSVAATTRVEVLEYKEIMTPSWRKISLSPSPVMSSSDEDTSDEAFVRRHAKGEVEEKKRLGGVAQVNSRANQVKNEEDKIWNYDGVIQ